MPFPADFRWGAATSAYQIEGSPLADGAGPSIWHRFAHTPGRTRNGETGDVACDHYRRWREDVGLMRDLGLTAYRFSIAWGRVLPEGTGRINDAGLDFYDRLVDALGEAGIRPFATLYHWDLPAALDNRGGWLNRDVAGWFAEYAEVVHRRLGDRVQHWMTLNEPWVSVDAGYAKGVHAPGHANRYETPRAMHHLLLAHAAGAEALRAGGAEHVGAAINLEPKVAASTSEEDVAAAHRADAYMNRAFLDPMLLGRYPDGLAELFGDAWHDPDPADLDRISAPLDFLGINYYTRSVSAHDPSASAFPEHAARTVPPGHTRTEMGWEVHPPTFEQLLLDTRERYGDLPLYITENGAAFYDPPRVPADGRIRDPLRTQYYRDHLRAIERAIGAGVDVRGYFAWSLMDNYEWSAGFSKRFGLFHVDFETLERTPKDTARFYAEVIRTNGACLGDEGYGMGDAG